MTFPPLALATSATSLPPTAMATVASDTTEPEISLRLERGDGAAHVYFSDLTAEYVRINSEYTT